LHAESGVFIWGRLLIHKDILLLKARMDSLDFDPDKYPSVRFSKTELSTATVFRIRRMTSPSSTLSP
jgi:hypothetical protein